MSIRKKFTQRGEQKLITTQVGNDVSLGESNFISSWKAWLANWRNYARIAGHLLGARRPAKLGRRFSLISGPKHSRGCYLANKVSFTRPCRHVHGICGVFYAERVKYCLWCNPSEALLLLFLRSSSFNIASSTYPSPTREINQSNLLLSPSFFFQQLPRAPIKNYFDLISQINLSCFGRVANPFPHRDSPTVSLLHVPSLSFYEPLSTHRAPARGQVRSLSRGRAARDHAEPDFWSQKHASYAKSLRNTSLANGDIFYGPWGKVVARYPAPAARREFVSRASFRREF